MFLNKTKFKKLKITDFFIELEDESSLFIDDVDDFNVECFLTRVFPND